MNKLTILALAGIASIALTACGDKKDDQPTEQTAQVQTTENPAVVTNETVEKNAQASEEVAQAAVPSQEPAVQSQSEKEDQNSEDDSDEEDSDEDAENEE